MFIPRKVKYRKQHKLPQKGPATKKIAVSFGSYGLKALAHAWITSRQIEAARRAITHYLKRGGKLWIRIYPDKSVSMKGAEVPMGGGKGGVDHYVAIVRPGTVLFELDGVERSIAQAALRLASYKLSVQTRFVEKTI
ncbi:50S ribosomal protein L16 [Candidatus Uhrbacteria bacterium]|nr:50S ribosomal protein L16 [Candidatus Uhrbacteria bacterium]